MSKDKARVRWYWFLETEAILGTAFAVGAVSFPFLDVRFGGTVSTCLVIAIGILGEYRRRLYRRPGTDWICAPAWFRMLWLFVIFVDLFLFAALR